MIFFTDPHHPTFKAKNKLKLITQAVPENISDEERVVIVNQFLEEYLEEHGKFPAIAIIERLANFILKPYTSRNDDEYKILSVYSMERHKDRELQYNDEYDAYYG